MSTAQPSFNTGTVIDPTRNALRAVTNARQSLSDMLDRNMKQEALQQAQARQKVLDDRATAEYTNKVNERNALGKFEQGILAPRQTYYGDVNNSKAMEYAKNVELNKNDTPEEREAKLKAQENFGNMITNNGAGYKETEWQKAQRVAREQGVGDSLAVAKRLYSIKAADQAARDAKQTDALKQKNDLLTQYNKVNDDIAKLQITKKKYVKGTKGTKNANSTLYKGDVWTPDAQSKSDEQANKMSSWLSTSWKSVWGNTDAKDAQNIVKYAQTLHVGPKQLGSILVKYGYGGEETVLGDERLRDPSNPKATPTQIFSKIRSEIDTAATNNTAAGKKGTDGFYYNTEDTSAALKLKKAQAAQLKAQMAGIRTDYTDDGRTAQEHSMDKINSLAEQYWSQPITGTTDKSGSKSGSSTGTTGKSGKAVIGGAIGEAVNTKGKGGELAKLVTENPIQFGKEYDSLGTEGKAKVDKILQSDASKKYFNSIDVNNTKDKVLPKETSQVPNEELAPGWKNTKYGPIYVGGKENSPTVSTKRLKHLLKFATSAEKEKILETLKFRGESVNDTTVAKTPTIKHEPKPSYSEERKKVVQQEMSLLKKILQDNKSHVPARHTAPLNIHTVLPQTDGFIRLPQQ